MKVASAAAGWARRRRRRQLLTEAGSVLLGAVLLIWSLLPIYNLFLIALDPEEGEVEFTGNIYPPEPDLDAFWVVLTQADRYLENFWQQFGNSLFIGLTTMLLTALIASPREASASRLISRRPRDPSARRACGAQSRSPTRITSTALTSPHA